MSMTSPETASIWSSITLPSAPTTSTSQTVYAVFLLQLGFDDRSLYLAGRGLDGLIDGHRDILLINSAI